MYPGHNQAGVFSCAGSTRVKGWHPTIHRDREADREPRPVRRVSSREIQFWRQHTELCYGRVNSTVSSFNTVVKSSLLNRLTGLGRLVTSSPGVPVVRALTFTNNTTALVANGSSGSEAMATINLTTGASTVLGAFNPSSVFSATLADSAGGPVYVLDSLGNEYTIAANGNRTLVVSTGNHFYLDLTIGTAASVPEPSTKCLDQFVHDRCSESRGLFAVQRQGTGISKRG